MLPIGTPVEQLDSKRAFAATLKIAKQSAREIFPNTKHCLKNQSRPDFFFFFF